MKPGTYNASETVPDGWSLTSATCNDGSQPNAIALGAGETVTCTFTNTKTAKVIVKKVMVGGTETFDFTGTPSGSISVNEGTIEANVAPGQQYVSTESIEPGWDLTSVTCNDGNSVGSVPNRTATFNVEAGETVTCTFTNTKQAKIIIEKQTDPPDYPMTFDFTGEIVATLADNETAEKLVAPGGTYRSPRRRRTSGISSRSPATTTTRRGASPTLTATFRVHAGEVVKCTFENRKRGDITVIKQTDPPNDPQSFSFNASWDPDGFSLVDDGSENSKGLVPGIYSVSENVPAGWALTSATCNDGSPINAIDLQPAEDIICTFNNTKQAKVIVKKVMVGGTASFPFTGTPAGSIAVNNGTIEAFVTPGQQYVSTEGLVPGLGPDHRRL